MNASQIAGLLEPIVGSDHVLTQKAQLIPYECDGLSAYRKLPLAVVKPATVEEVCAVMKECYKNGVPVVARGAGTGLSGGALPHEKGILLSLARFNAIKKIDTDNRLAVVEPGVRNLAISEAVSHLGLYYAPDPSSQIACSIGGNVAENSGGVHCLKYGLTVHNILQLKVVTVEGELIEIGSTALDSPGFDLLALMTGSEGMLGIVVEVTVKLLAIPAAAKALLGVFDDVERAGKSVADIISAGILPAGLEMMDNLSIRATEDFVHAGYPVEAAAILICELDGTDEEVDNQIQLCRKVLLESGASEVRVSANEAERQRFWSGRKNAFPAVGRISPDYYCIDGTIPRKELGAILRGIASLSEQFNLRVANVFHAGDGNLHPLILYDANIPGEFDRTEKLGGKILEMCVAAGGTITGEHGVGIEKINQMCIQFGHDELEQFHGIKYAFDSQGLLNPGKAVPTLARCAEFNAMHVHNGELPFAELERF
ncbi:MAG: glycolate oxidase [Parasphingorhabdus sp.]|jgi:glycolate oxidase